MSEGLDPVTEDSQGFLAEWQRWRLARFAAINAPDGPPTLDATYWLDASDRVPGVPGTWLDRDGEVVVTLPRAEALITASGSLSGELVTLARGQEIGQKIELSELTLQVVSRSGRRGVRVFNHARAYSVGDIEAFEPSPAWVIQGRFTPLAKNATLAYRYALEAAPRPVEVPGLVSFVLNGRAYGTKPFLDEGVLLLVFSDRTTGQTTKPPSRFLCIALPEGGGRRAAPVMLDFNRAFLPPCAFSDQFNCPLPPAEHQLHVAVTAGETWAHWTRAVESTAR